MQGYNARKLNCSCLYIETREPENPEMEFVNKNICISASLVSKEDIKASNFDTYDNSHNNFL